MASEKRLDHKEYARQMRTHAVADAGVIRVSAELWEQIADIVENSVEVVHGRWIEKKLDNFRKWELRCSECGWVGISNYDAYDEPFDFNYCPNCGANMMDGGNEDG